MHGVQARSDRHTRRGDATAEPAILHLAVTRSAAVRLAPVAAALPGPQLLVDASGRVAEWLTAEPPVVSRLPLPSAGDVARAVSVALATVRPDVVIVAGDGDATLAGALAVAHAGVPVARLGAGLRCGDRTSAREVNRIAIDAMAARLYTDSEFADENLVVEGVMPAMIVNVGSTMPDVIDRWRERALEAAMWTRAGLRRQGYILVFLNRPESFAHTERLVGAIAALARRHPVLLCVEPQRRGALEAAGLLRPVLAAGAVVTCPLDYVEYLSLLAGASAALTDSAGVQEESSVLGIDCFTLAETSERTLTLTDGTNTLLGGDPAAIEHVRPSITDSGPERLSWWGEDAGRRVAADLLDVPWKHE